MKIRTKIQYLLAVFAVSIVGMLVANSSHRVEAAGELQITFPESSVSAEPDVATRTIVDDNGSFTIPYIQTESSISPTATVDGSKVPAGGGVKFVLDEGLPGEVIKYDMTGTSPYSVTFDSLTKAEHTLDVYVVNSSQVVQVGVDKQDGLTRVGVGDIIAAIGDSITAGYPDDLSAVADWTEANPGQISTDERNFAQNDPFDNKNRVGAMADLNDQLTTSHGYPVFIMNEGVGGMYAGLANFNVTAGSPVPNPSQIARLTDLKPSKWIIHLGVNDARGDWPSNEYIDQMGYLVDALMTDYDADSEDIFIAKPLAIYEPSDPARNALEVSYSSDLNALISSKEVMNGPDFFSLFTDNYPDYYAIGDPQPDYHPSSLGYDTIADLQTLTFAKPDNVDVVFDTGNYLVAWDDMSAKHAEVSGYEVRYGTDPDNLQTVNVGTDLDYTITDITNADQGKRLYVYVRALYDITVSDYIAKSDWSDLNSSLVDGAPSIPLDVTAVAGNKQAEVSFTEPISDGNHTITEYTVTSSPGGITATGTGSPITVTGLTNGTDYTFTVRATNSEGDSPESDPSNQVNYPSVIDSALIMDIQDPENLVAGQSITIDLVLTNYGYDDLSLSAFNGGGPASLLAAILYPMDVLSFDTATTPDISCSDLGRVGDSAAASILSNHLDYGIMMCVYTGSSVLVPDESFLSSLRFTVNETPTSSFSIFGTNFANENDPDRESILGILNAGYDIIDATSFLELNNTNQYSFVLGDQDTGNNVSNNASGGDTSGTLQKTGQYIASQKLLLAVIAFCSIAIGLVQKRKHS